MTTIYLVRHAEAEGNHYRRAHGWYNSTITDRGYRQIAALAARFAQTHFDAVYSSDRFRTMTTALSVYKTHDLPLHLDARLREVDVGYWEDIPWAEIERIDGEQLTLFNTDAAHWHVDGSEQIAAVCERMCDALREIAERHDGETVAVFSHGMAMRIALGTLQGLSLHEIDATGHAENTAVAKLTFENGRFTVVYRDDASHLSDDIATIRRQPWVKDGRGFEGGIHYRASGAEGHFDVLRGEEIIGAVSVDSCRAGVAVLGEFWLENDAQRRGDGEKLVGQVLSYARTRGCNTLSTGRIPKSNAVALHCAEKRGFVKRAEDAESVTFTKSFEYDEESCWEKLQDVMKR